MKVLFISRECCTNPLAYAMVCHGDEVKMWIRDEEYQEIGDGFVEKVDSWEPHVEWADLVITDDSEFGDIAERLRKQGKPVIGGSKVFDELEMEREAGQKMFEAVGMQVLQNHEFQTFEEAIAHCEENPVRCVIKVDGEAQNNKMLTYVGQDEEGRDIVPMLEHIEELDPKNLEGIEIQDHVDGIEVAIGGFFNGEDFCDPVEINFEHKRLCVGDIGPNTPELGTGLLWINKDQRIYKETIGRFVPLLKKEGYHGHFDINTIVTEDAIYPLEMTCRFGYPTLNVMMETIDTTNWAEFFHRLAVGDLKEFDTFRDYGVNVVICSPPMPYDNEELWETISKDMPVISTEGEYGQGIYPADLKMDKDGLWRVTGNSGYSAIISAAGDSFEEAREEAYERVKQIIIPNMFYRTDVAEHLSEKLEELESYGLLSASLSRVQPAHV